MAQFDRLVLTDKGRALQTKAQTGTLLEFTRVAIGSGTLAEGTEINTVTSLVEEQESLDITSIEIIGDGTSRIRTSVSNQGLAAGYYIREIGVFATDPTEGEILYCYSNAGDMADFLPAGTGASIVESILNLVTVIGNATNVTAVIETEVYMTKQEKDEIDVKLDNALSSLAEKAAQINSKEINVLYPPAPLMAAKGDDVTDDAPAINGIINHLHLNGGGVVLLAPPPNAYRIKDTILIKNGVSIIGADNRSNTVNYGTIIHYEGTGIAFRCYTYLNDTKLGNVDSYSNVVIKGFFLKDVNQTGSIGFDLHGFRWSELENVAVLGFNKGLHTWHCYYANFKNLLFVFYRTNAIHSESQDNNTTWEKIKISKALTEGTNKAAIFSYAFNLVLNNVSVEINTMTGISIENCKAVVVNGLYYEVFSDTTTLTAGLTFLSTQGVIVQGGEFQGNNKCTRGVYGYGSDNIVIVGNSFRSFTVAPIVNASIVAGDNKNFLQMNNTTDATRTQLLAQGNTGGEMVGGWRHINWTQYEAAPATGTWNVGDIVYKKTPVAGGYLGWVCTTSGTPGTWKGFGLIEA